jgi:hypothetical protein
VDLLRGPQGIPGGTLNWRGDYDPDTQYAANDGVRYGGRSFYAVQPTLGNAPPTWPDEDDAFWNLFAERGQDGANGVDGAKTIWTAMPGNPFRLSDTSFKILDVSNQNGYDKMLSPKTVISWIDSVVGWQAAKIVSSSYANNYVTVNIMGNTLSSTFSNMKYCIYQALEDQWVLPGVLPESAQTNLGRALFWKENRYVFSAQIVYGTASQNISTDAIWDINANGSSIFSTKIKVVHKQTVGIETQSDSMIGTQNTPISGVLTLDYDSGYATDPGSDAYVMIWSMPVAWRFMP